MRQPAARTKSARARAIVPGAAQPGLPVWLMGALLVVATIAVNVPALRGGSIWDNDTYVTRNAMRTAPNGLSQIWFSAHRLG
jgi:hypothetical protein